MKRTLALILTLLLVFSLAGCTFPDVFRFGKQLDKADQIIPEVFGEAESKPEEATPAPTEATEPPTAVTEAPTEPVVQSNLLDSFSRDEMHRINIFLSNFSEQNFDTYPCDDYAVATFAFLFAKYNGGDMVKVSEAYYYITDSDMDAVTNRFFGKKLNLQDPSTLTGEYGQTISYHDGAYYFPAADGASVSYCTIATSMVDNGDETYSVTFDVYGHVSPHESMASFYSMTGSEAKSESQLEYLYSGKAVVRDYVRSGNIPTYQLISYSRG